MSQQGPDREPTDGDVRLMDLGDEILVLVHVVIKGMEEELSLFGMTLSEFGVLKMLASAESRTATEMARVLPLDASRISRIVTRLNDMGLVRRRRLRDDRRVVHLELTEEGRRISNRMVESVNARNAQLREGVPEGDMLNFISTIHKLVANFTTRQQTAAEEADEDGP